MNAKTNEILQITQEECAEVVQAVAKIFRFGVNAVYENQTNQHRLEGELGDLQCMIDLLIERGVVDAHNVQRASELKRQKLYQWSNIFKDDL